MIQPRESLHCVRCWAELRPGEGNLYVVRILAVADPYPPIVSERDVLEDIGTEIQRLLAEIQGKTDRELMDQVYRRKLFHLCGPCYRWWIEDPIRDR
jgi:hypothetical protein